QHKTLRACLTEFKLDSVGITHVDLTHGREQGRAWATEASGGRDEAGGGGFHVFPGEIATVVEFDALTQEKRVGFAIFGNFPTVGQVRDDTLPAVARVAPDQVVVHAALGTNIGDGS